MIYISEGANITNCVVVARTKEEEKELRDSYEVKRSVDNAQNQKMKTRNYYRLVNGRPRPGVLKEWRDTTNLVESGFLLLDWDRKPGMKMTNLEVWKLLKPHIKEWGIVHAEKSARGGLHVTVVRTENLSRVENIRLMELRTGLKFDYACQDVARSCFLVSNKYVLMESDAYYEDFPTPLQMSAEDQLLMEQERERLQQEVEERRKTAPVVNYEGNTDEESQLLHIIQLIVNQQVDITADYHNWIEIGFIITNIMGIAGESLFHEVSRFYPGYDYQETSRTYNNLTRTTRREVHLGTLIYLARQEGVVR